MDLRTNRNALKLFREIYDYRRTVTPALVTQPQKPAFDDSQPLLQPFPRSSPEAQGVPSEQISRFLAAMNEDATLDLHGVMVIRNAHVIAEANFGAYDQRIWHITHSGCKSITGLAIGMLIDEGRLSLDDRILKIFETRTLSLSLLTHKNMTVRHLLTMSSGVLFNETGAVTEKDWVKSFLESAVLYEPGSKFTYNSMNTYMLSAIVREVSGQGLMDYLQERLWRPLGITGIFWETCPKGIEKGGWGLYIRPEDLAKVGQIVMQGGRWEGRQLVSEAWIRAATSVQIEVPASLGSFDYGFQTWVSRKRDAFLFNGMFGQNMLGLRDSGILIVVNSGNDEFFQQSNFFALAEDYFPDKFAPDGSLPENRKAEKQLQALKNDLTQIEGFRKNTWLQRLARIPEINLTEFCSELDGRIFITDTAESAAVGLMPLLTQLVQNNYTKGLKSLVFRYVDGILQLTVNENDESHRLPLGFEKPLLTDLKFHGEPYRVAVSSRLTTDEDDNLVLKVHIAFLEIANERLIRFYFNGDRLLTRWTERPGLPFFINAFDLIKGEVKSRPMVFSLIQKADSDYVRYKLSRCLEPEVTAHQSRFEKQEVPDVVLKTS